MGCEEWGGKREGRAGRLARRVLALPLQRKGRTARLLASADRLELRHVGRLNAAAAGGQVSGTLAPECTELRKLARVCTQSILGAAERGQRGGVGGVRGGGGAHGDPSSCSLKSLVTSSSSWLLSTKIARLRTHWNLTNLSGRGCTGGKMPQKHLRIREGHAKAGICFPYVYMCARVWWKARKGGEGGSWGDGGGGFTSALVRSASDNSRS